MKRISHLLDLKRQAIKKAKRDPARAEQHKAIAQAITQRIREIIGFEKANSTVKSDE